MDPFADLKRTFHMTVLANAAVIASLFILTAVVEIIKSRLKSFQGLFQIPNSQVVRYIFYGLAVLIVISIRVLSRTLVRSHHGDSSGVFIQRLSRAAIFTSSLAEIPALLGFVLFLLIGASRDFYYLLFFSLVLEFMYFPRIKAWEEMIRKTYPQAHT
jgi:hypothetical protein